MSIFQPRHGVVSKGFTFRTPPNSTSNPHASIQMQIPRIASLHGDVNSEGVGLGVDLLRGSRIVEFFEEFTGTDAPAVVLHCDVGGWVVVRLEEIVGGEVRGEVGGDELGVLAAGLGGKSVYQVVRVQGSVKRPHDRERQGRCNGCEYRGKAAACGGI